MQILVVVANIQVRTLKAEVEKGSMRTAVGHGSGGPKRSGDSVQSRGVPCCFAYCVLCTMCARVCCMCWQPLGAKGNRVNIPDPAHGDRWHLTVCDCLVWLCQLGVIKRGNANELGDVGKSSGKSFLFFVRMVTTPGIGLSGDRGITSVKHHPSCGVRNALVGP